MISPLAYVDPSVKLGNNVEIKPFAYIEAGVEIGDNCVIMPHASILEGTIMGKNNIIYQNAVIGATPQDFHYQEGHPHRVIIGDDNRLIIKINDKVMEIIEYENNFGVFLNDYIGDFIFDTIAVRIPNHELALRILSENGPMATSSVNVSS